MEENVSGCFFLNIVQIIDLSCLLDAHESCCLLGRWYRLRNNVCESINKLRLVQWCRSIYAISRQIDLTHAHADQSDIQYMSQFRSTHYRLCTIQVQCSKKPACLWNGNRTRGCGAEYINEQYHCTLLQRKKTRDKFLFTWLPTVITFANQMYSVSQNPPPPAACGFLTFFDKRLRILNPFLHTYYTFLSTLDYKFLFSYLKL